MGSISGANLAAEMGGFIAGKLQVYLEQFKDEQRPESDCHPEAFEQIVKKQVEIHGAEGFEAQFRHKGVIIPFDLCARQLIHPAISEFLEFNFTFNYAGGVDIVLHTPSDRKTDIGYPSRDVAITLVYRDAWGHDNYLVFARQHDFDELGHPHESDRIQKEIVKQIVGHKDVVSAARRAEEGLLTVCKSGSLGPFFMKQGDSVFMDEDTYEDYSDAPHKKANFSCGHRMLSFNANFVEFAYALGRWHQAPIQICSLKNPDRFRANDGVQALLEKKRAQPKILLR